MGGKDGGRSRADGVERVAAELAPEKMAAALLAALEAFGAPAFLVAADGAVVHANAAGQLLREADGRALQAELARSVSQRGEDFAVTPIGGPGAATHFIAVQRARISRPESRAALAGRRWGLTRRQREVLTEVARGRSNRDIARALGCAESTVELHVTAVLDKSGCQGRAELVARFWAED